MKYLSNIKIAFKQGLASRITTLMQVIAKPLLIIISIALWNTVYNQTNNDTINGFTINETINYMMFSIIFGAITYTNVGSIVGNDILMGKLSTRLIRPVDYGLERLSRTIGNRLYALIFEVLPGVIIGIMLGFHLYNYLMTIISIISIWLGLIINFFISLNWSLMYFKVKNSWSLEGLKGELVNFLSGVYFPIYFMPLTIQKMFNYLPFQFIIYVPSRIFINSYTLTQTMIFIIIQLAWITILYSTYKIGWHHALKNFEGVGA